MSWESQCPGCKVSLVPIMNPIHPAVEARGFFAESEPSWVTYSRESPISNHPREVEMPCRSEELHTSLFTGIQENQGRKTTLKPTDTARVFP